MSAGPDPSTPRDAAEALAALTAAIAAHESDGDGLRYLERPLREYCRLAHREGVPPEHILARLKPLFATRPPRSKAHAPVRESLEVRFVSMAIDAYFADED